MLSAKRSENKILAVIVLTIIVLKFLKTVLKNVSAWKAAETSFVYTAPTSKLKNKVRRISYWSENLV